MKVSRHELYRIIVEEYARDTGIDESQVDDLIAHIKGGPKPDWMDDDEQDVPDPPEVPPAPDQSDVTSSETYPMDIPSDDAQETEYRGFQADSGAPVEDQLLALIQGMDPEAVAELFQTVFEKLPGVELSSPGDEDYPGEETLYSPGAEGRPTAGFKLEELMSLIEEVIAEGHYHDMGGGDEMYNVLDPHGFEDMPDNELIDMVRKDGMEEIIVLDGEGDLANREEVIAALKDV
jgi:hypothetical protein